MAGNKNTYLEKLEQIRSSGDFKKLRPYKRAERWTKMSSEEKDALAKLFLLQGEEQLKKGTKKVPEAFGLARELSPEDEQVLTMSAYAHICCQKSNKDLEQACHFAREAIQINPDYLDAWSVWGTALLHRALDLEDEGLFQEAHKKFLAAYAIKRPQVKLNQEFYMQWAMALYGIARNSQEPHDYKEAIEKFRSVIETGEVGDPFFWDHYGNTLSELSYLINRPEYLTEAASCYKTATELSSNFVDAWFHLATCQHRIWEISGEEIFFQDANAAYEEAIKINNKEPIYWFKWGQLLSSSAQKRRDMGCAAQAHSHFKKVDDLDPDQAPVLASWSEIQLYMGKETESLKDIKEAEERIRKVVKTNPNEGQYRNIYAMCLHELGVYFDDADYFRQATAQLRRAIKKEPTNPILWYALAQNSFMIGVSQDEIRPLQQALSYCSRVVEFEQNVPSHLWFFWGVVLIKLAELTNHEKNIILAIEKFEKAIWPENDKLTMTRVNPEWLFHYGCALDYLGEVIDDSKQDDRVLYYERSVKALSNTLILSPNFPEARYHLALVFSHLGDATYNLDYYYKASELFRQLTGSDPENCSAWNDWGLVLIEIAQIVEDPAHLDLLYRLFHEAEEKLLRAAALGHVQANYNLAGLYALSNQPEAAVHYLERAKQANALPALDYILHDSWLERIQESDIFKAFISQLEDNS